MSEQSLPVEAILEKHDKRLSTLERTMFTTATVARRALHEKEDLKEEVRAIRRDMKTLLELQAQVKVIPRLITVSSVILGGLVWLLNHLR